MWQKIGERLEQIRMGLNMSKVQFGKMVGVTGQHLGMVEKGKRRLSVEVIARICQTTGVSADYLLLGIVNPMNDPETTAALSGLSQEQIIIALDIIKRVAEFVNTEGGNEALIQEVSKNRAGR